MIKVGVICAMEEEIRTLLAKQTQQHETVIASQHYFEGQIDGIDVILVQSGIGKVQAAITFVCRNHFGNRWRNHR